VRSVSRDRERCRAGAREPGYVVAVSERQSEKGSRFRALHEGDPFLIPNPWDVGSARLLESLGFEALASSSAGLAFSHGGKDGDATLDEVVEHTKAVDRATELPLSVDLENGYGSEPEDAATAIERAAAAGAVGGSIEDYDPNGKIYDPGHAAERVAAAAEASRRLDFPFTFTARAENHIRGNPDLGDTIARLQAYEAAGADVLYAPGLTGGEQVRAVREATGLPLNVLAFAGLDLAEMIEAGAQRISVGSGFAWTAYEAMASAAEAMRDHGDLSGLLPPTRVAKLP
jgi:2-methylisocitrate lyase-like PEP mutase family enzyme